MDMSKYYHGLVVVGARRLEYIYSCNDQCTTNCSFSFYGYNQHCSFGKIIRLKLEVSQVARVVELSTNSHKFVSGFGTPCSVIIAKSHTSRPRLTEWLVNKTL